MSGPDPGEPRGPFASMLSPRVFVHLLAFAAFLALLTWKLLEPRPVPEALTESLSGNWLFILAKCFHAGAYAFMAVLAATAPVARPWRAALVVLMFLHGIGTEIGQTYVPNRTGKVTDVLIDWAGITAGLVALRWWSRRPASRLNARHYPALFLRASHSSAVTSTSRALLPLYAPTIPSSAMKSISRLARP